MERDNWMRYGMFQEESTSDGEGQTREPAVTDEHPSREILNMYLKHLCHYKHKHHHCLSPELHKLMSC